MTVVVIPGTLDGWRTYPGFKSLGPGGALNGSGLYIAEGRLVFASLERSDVYSLRISLSYAFGERTFDLVMRRIPGPSREGSLAQILLSVSEQNPGGIDGRLGFNVALHGSPHMVPNYIHITDVTLKGLSNPSAIEVVVKQKRVCAYVGPALPYVPPRPA